MHFHAIVWIDHRSAQIFGFGREDFTSCQFVSCEDAQRVHHKAGITGSGHVHGQQAYFENVANASAEFREILIVGPAQTKNEFKAFLLHNRPQLAAHVLGVEALECAGEGEIVGFARHFFARADRMTARRKRGSPAPLAQRK